MTVYVLGAGASHHAGYPLCGAMGSQLFGWMRSQASAQGFKSCFPSTAQFLDAQFSQIKDIEDLFTELQRQIDLGRGTLDQLHRCAALEDKRCILVDALRVWFNEIRQQRSADAYRRFATEIVAPGDCIITFNYDVSLERELKSACKFEVGDGYGFTIESFPNSSPTKILKLHGSTSWLALAFTGVKSNAQGQAFVWEGGNILGERPVIERGEFSFLGYSGLFDPAFPNGDGSALPVMIMPTRSKEFFFALGNRTEYNNFWCGLWQRAEKALRAADRIVICGYSMPEADERARELLLHSAKKDAEVVVASGDDTQRIVAECLESGASKAAAAEAVYFEDWVESQMSISAGKK